MSNYVKFKRGTPSAYETLLKNPLKLPDSDTLYFISETDSDEGVLYLGTKKIGGSSINFNDFSIESLKDVAISENLTDKSILVYSEKDESWVNIDFNSLTFVGSTTQSSGLGGFVPAPGENEVDLILCSDGTWKSVLSLPKIQELSQKIETNSSAIEAVIGLIDTKINTAISSLLTIKVLESEEELDTFIDENLMTAGRYLYLIPKPDSNFFDEYVVVDGKKEKVGDTSIDLSGYATTDALNNAISNLVSKTEFNTTVGNLNTVIDSLLSKTEFNTTISNINSSITSLQNKDTEINGALANINNAIASLQNANTGFTNGLTSLNNEISALKTSDENLTNEIKIIKEQITWEDLDEEKGE